MSFFISESLKGRVTEESLLADDDDKLRAEKNLFVKAVFNDHFHDFELCSFSIKSQSKELTIEIPDSYKYLKSLLTSKVEFQIVSAEGIITKVKNDNADYEVISQNKRSCYLLKIFIKNS